MSVQVFVDGKEVCLSPKPAGEPAPTAFELGFDAAVRSHPHPCPYAAYTPQEEDWLSGHTLFIQRRNAYDWHNWDSESYPGESSNHSYTLLCLVLDQRGLYRHIPCQFNFMGFGGGSWSPCAGERYQKIIAWTRIDIPHRQNDSEGKRSNLWFKKHPIDQENLE